MNELNEYSREFARALFESFPWMQPHANVDPHPQVDQGSLLVEIAPPPIRKDSLFWISTDRGEVTVGFGMFHTHFDWQADGGEEDWEAALEFIRGLTEDRVLIEDWTKGGVWSGSTTLQRGAQPDLSKMADDNVIMIRSWSGRFDRTISGTDRRG